MPLCILRTNPNAGVRKLTSLIWVRAIRLSKRFVVGFILHASRELGNNRNAGQVSTVFTRLKADPRYKPEKEEAPPARSPTSEAIKNAQTP